MTPKILEPNFAGVPASLRAIPAWVCWVAVFEGGKIKKPPVQAAGQNQGRLANKANPAHLCTFDRAMRFYEINQGDQLQGGRLAGIGLVLTKHTGIVGIDLDHCVENGVVNTWAAGIIESVGGYAELSPSGSGVHIYIRGRLPFDNRRSGGIEIYSHNSYLTVTGHWLRTEGALSGIAA